MSYEPAQAKQAVTPAASDAVREPASGVGTSKEPSGATKLPREKVNPPAISAESVSTQLGVKVPSILLEGDEPELPAAGELGLKYVVTPAAAGNQTQPQPEALTESYETGRLLLAARDPHALYLHWDAASALPKAAQALPEFCVRLRVGGQTGSEVTEVRVPAELRHWFIYAPQAATSYQAELGFYGADRGWMSFGNSNEARTPADSPSKDKEARFATFPIETPLGPPQPPREAPVAAVSGNEEPIRSVISPPPPFLPAAVLGGQARPGDVEPGGETPILSSPPLDPPAGALGLAVQRADEPEESSAWTSEQERQLTELIGWVQFSGDWAGSAQIPELLYGRRQAISTTPGLPPGQVLEESAVGLLQPVSSPAGGERPVPQGFWLNVNAELVVYGATEPSARVTLGGKPIQLRPDGTFSFRFSLPDGQYGLPIQAESAAGEVRKIRLDFQRSTACQGEVGICPQDPTLNEPGAASKL